jgi:hypothetical protein
METLLPCRACGNKAIVGSAEIAVSPETQSLKRAWVACSACSRRTVDFNSLDEAFASWNQAQSTTEITAAHAEQLSPVIP